MTKPYFFFGHPDGGQILDSDGQEFVYIPVPVEVTLNDTGNILSSPVDVYRLEIGRRYYQYQGRLDV